MEYQTIISQSGTRHFINPAPVKSVGQTSGRVQTLCSFHVRPELSAAEPTQDCKFCPIEAERIERQSVK
jgi:hypothetical protein